MAIITRHRRKIIVKIIVSLIVATVVLYFAGKSYSIIMLSKYARYPVPIETVEIEESVPENPHDYGDCIADWPWNVEVMNPDIDSNLSINKEKHIMFNYSSDVLEKTLYSTMLENDNSRAFLEQNNIHSDEDLTCYLYSYNSKDVSMKYLFKPMKELGKASLLSGLQTVCEREAVKVYDVRKGDLRVILEVVKRGHDTGTLYMITIKSPSNKKIRFFTILDSRNHLTEGDVIHFISTISIKEE